MSRTLEGEGYCKAVGSQGPECGNENVGGCNSFLFMSDEELTRTLPYILPPALLPAPPSSSSNLLKEAAASLASERLRLLKPLFLKHGDTSSLHSAHTNGPQISLPKRTPPSCFQTTSTPFHNPPSFFSSIDFPSYPITFPPRSNICPRPERQRAVVLGRRGPVGVIPLSKRGDNNRCVVRCWSMVDQLVEYLEQEKKQQQMRIQSTFPAPFKERAAPIRAQQLAFSILGG
ncbi:uncharacterized protein [Pleurodeles waltl]|uniref:uncharacterized protein n=1 Tax=Pleurodeles waltl TaxID=8319 RepID=UPI0037097897